MAHQIATLVTESSFIFRVYFEGITRISFTRMEKGTIARIMDKGYGFIKREGEEKDLFFHSNEVQGVEFNSLQEGDEVEFEVTEGEKGPQAVNVSKV